MISATRVFPSILLLLFLSGGGFQSAVGETDVEFAPVALVAGLEETFLLCGNYYADNEEGYWVWKVDAGGEQVWTKKFPGEHQDELVTVLPAESGGCTALGRRFMQGPQTGYMPFIQTIDANGNAGTKKDVNASGIVQAILQLRDGSFLLAGAAEKDEKDATAKQEGGGDNTGYDAWLLRVNATGSILWQKWLDRGNDETIYALLEAPEGGFYCLANSGKLDKFGSGSSEAWLFKCSGEGAIEREVSVTDGRFVTSGGDGLLVRNGDLLTFVCSLPQSAVSKDIKRDPFSFPARIVAFSVSLEQKWETDFLENRTISTPVLAVAPREGYLLASAGAKAPVLTQFSPQGIVQKTIKGKKWPFQPMMALEALHVKGTTAHVLGSVCDFMSDEDDSEHVFLTRFDLLKGKTVWQKTY